MSTPRVSIVIPTKNGAKTLPALLDALWREPERFPIEIVAVDSGSTDGTVELLRPRVQRLLTVPAVAFNHGLTRNAGIEASTGEFVVLTVQDAAPATPGWLQAIVSPLEQDPRVAGAFARQQPRTDASAITRWHAERWIAGSIEPRIVSIPEPLAFDRLDPMDRLRTYAFDNVCSCIRRSVWQTIPFRATTIAEDLEWALEVLRAGHRIAYVPEAVVTHSHERSTTEELRRTRLLHERLFALYGLRTIPSLPHLARAMTSSFVQHAWVSRREPWTIARSAGLAVAWPLGQYLGGRAGERGETTSILRRT